MKGKPRFRKGQVVAVRLPGYVAKVQDHYHDSSGSDVWWYELVEDATPCAEQELRPLTQRERGQSMKDTGRKGKPSGLGEQFDKWWATVRDDYKNHISETVAKAAWVTAWSVAKSEPKP